MRATPARIPGQRSVPVGFVLSLLARIALVRGLRPIRAVGRPYARRWLAFWRTHGRIFDLKECRLVHCRCRFQARRIATPVRIALIASTNQATMVIAVSMISCSRWPCTGLAPSVPPCARRARSARSPGRAWATRGYTRACALRPGWRCKRSGSRRPVRPPPPSPRAVGRTCSFRQRLPNTVAGDPEQGRQSHQNADRVEPVQVGHLNHLLTVSGDRLAVDRLVDRVMRDVDLFEFMSHEVLRPEAGQVVVLDRLTRPDDGHDRVTDRQPVGQKYELPAIERRDYRTHAVAVLRALDLNEKDLFDPDRYQVGYALRPGRPDEVVARRL